MLFKGRDGCERQWAPNTQTTTTTDCFCNGWQHAPFRLASRLTFDSSEIIIFELSE
eukprot:m.80032 g.80032  ORF g.80032 m.80032 type:complete len:56 (-) comp50677_c0_seq8:220-387(-)